MNNRNLDNIDFFENYKKIEHDHSFVPTKENQTLIYPLIGCGKIDRIQWWSEFYIGCNYDCKYCFVCIESLKYGVIKNREEWKNPRLKYSMKNIFTIFEEELDKVKQGETILHSMTADPFMKNHIESKELHLKIAEVVNERKIINRFLTKGLYDNINLDSNLNQFGSSISNLNESERKILEPNAPKVKDRIKSLKKLSKEGYFTFANILCIPFKSSLKDIDKILRKIDFVDEISFHGLYYFGHPTKEEYEYYYNISSKIYGFTHNNNKSFYTTGLLNPYIRNRLKNEKIG